MAAMIEFICIATHERKSDPSVTLEQRAWAYCSAGASDGHEWTRIDPTAVEILRSKVTYGRTHLLADHSHEPHLTGRPAR